MPSPTFLAYRSSAPSHSFGARALLSTACSVLAISFVSAAQAQSWSNSNAAPQPVPGYVAPVTPANVPAYVDDTRGVYVPPHKQLRQKTSNELASWNDTADTARPLYAQRNPNGQPYEQALNTVANGVADTNRELERISQDPGLLADSRRAAQSSDAKLYAQDAYADSTGLQLAQARLPAASMADLAPAAGAAKNLADYPSLATGGQPRAIAPAPASVAETPAASAPSVPLSGRALQDGGIELAVGANTNTLGKLDLQNGIVRLKEERITVRRALQRMLDQIGGSTWTTVWDLDETNAALPDMEISIYAEEPFIKVMNALLARLQTRSGQPIRVIKYERTQRLVITDRVGGDARSASIGAGKATDAAVTETVLKESMVSLHFDEVPLVDALENIVNQAGKGQWRLRMYAGTDQVLKPAHVEEPFGVALERILKVFNLRYEVFPGGKLIVVTSGNSFGFRGVE